MRLMHVFGPVASRRLGRSLGVDLVPHKACSFDCVYCEVGRTTQKTTARREFFPRAEVEAELSASLSGLPELDSVTFSGSGEPTLSLSLGDLIRFIKERYPVYRVAVLTNGSLLGDPAVREELRPADVVLPTLSTTREEIFQAVHRPAEGLTVRGIIDGLRRFREVYTGEIWLEVFLVPGINTGEEELRELREAVLEIRPDKIHLNTLDRPGAERWVRPAGPDELARAARVLGAGDVTVIPPALYTVPRGFPRGEVRSLVVETLKRRPSTLDDLVALTGLHRQEVGKMLRELSADPRLKSRQEERGLFYWWSED